MPISSDDIQLTAPAPGPVMGVSAQIIGPPGLALYHYWWVANYPIGVTVVSAAVLVRNAPSPLSATNYVTITGQAALGATKYDLLRTNGPNLPSGTANIAVATGLTSPTFNDQGAALTAYNVAGLAAGAPVSAFINLNNRDYAQPTIVMSPFGTAVQSLVFPDGTTQSTAGATPAQIYSWTQNVQANGNQLFGLGRLELLGGTFGFTLRTTSIGGAFPAGTLLLQNETTGLFGVTINQNGDVWIGAQSTPSRAARLYVTTPTGYAGNLANPLLVCFNGLSAASMILENASGAQNSTFSIKTLQGNFGLNVNTTTFYVFDENASPNGYRWILTGAGNTGLANGTFFTPAHLLELSTDDAAKPTTNTWTITSDIRTKNNVRPLEGGMSVIAALEPIVAEYNGLAQTPDGTRVVSFDPDQLAPILPAAVKSFRGKLRPDDIEETDIKAINNHEVIFHLILAVQQLSQQLTDFEADLPVGAERRKR